MFDIDSIGLFESWSIESWKFATQMSALSLSDWGECIRSILTTCAFLGVVLMDEAGLDF